MRSIERMVPHRSCPQRLMRPHPLMNAECFRSSSLGSDFRYTLSDSGRDVQGQSAHRSSMGSTKADA
jgi:hypothetical protein